MAHRKLQQDIDKVLKKVSEGVVIFDGLYEKIQECENQPQKEKLEDSLKKEIKKLQRNRDQLKTWAQMGEIKDKKPLLDNRKLIETKMEMFKAVEKEMKTKAYSKEGLATSAKKDPKEQEKEDAAQFVRDMQDELRQQIESREAEIDTLNAGKKGKKDSSKDVRKQKLTDSVERHKWHEDKLELILRALENGNVEPAEVKNLEEGIDYYVKHNEDMDFMEDDEMYDELNLTDSEQVFGMNTDTNDLDKVSSEDAQDLPDQAPEATAAKPVAAPVKQKAAAPVETAATRRPSTQLKSPLPVLATLNTLSSNAQTPSIPAAKPAPVPTRAPGEPLRYASAAAAATINDKNGIGIAPLPPGPVPSAAAVISSTIRQPSVGASPHSVVSVPVQQRTAASTPQTAEATLASRAAKSPAPSHVSHADATSDVKAPSQQPQEKHEPAESSPAIPATAGVKLPADNVASVQSLPNGSAQSVQPPETESVFHLPLGLEDLLESWEATKAEAGSIGKPIDERLLAASHASLPESVDAERPRHYRPQNPYPFVPESYPQEPLAIFDDPRLYSRIETDALFYAFYYRQGTYQQYLAAKALKAQSWRFHKQYQTWFQRHEEPKAITEEFEQGTYRFFDYESTWMNRRKADFKFAYKFLEDDL